MQIPIVKGIYTDNGPDIRTSYPVNMMPVAQQSGISNGYLKPADGIISQGTGSGLTRGGINWPTGSTERCYRVMGDQLVYIDPDGTVSELGEVGNDGKLVSMDYGFNLLGIASNNKLYYWDGATLTLVTDTDLGDVIDMIWIDGYFMTTDGEFLVTTELNDPSSVNPAKYGSSEIDPDPVIALMKLRNEAVAVNRYTIEYFRNVGGSGFPFARIEGAQLQRGCVGTHACCVYLESIAFVGSGRNEQPEVYLGANGQTTKISTREIDLILEDYTEAQLSLIKVESRNDKDSNLLYIHLPDKTLVYDHSTSLALQSPTWHILTTSTIGLAQYRAYCLVYAYGKWLVGDPSSNEIGYLDDQIGSHYGNTVSWQFGTSMIYNESNGAIIHEIELVGLTGRIALGDDPRISTAYSVDGQKWGEEKAIAAGKIGDRNKRLVWYRQGHLRNFRMQRFRGDSSAHMTFARLEAKIEPLR